jgi:hypothetical protein
MRDMKRILIFILCVVVLAGIVIYMRSIASTSAEPDIFPTPLVTIQPTSQIEAYCTLANLQSGFTTEGAAGSTYGTFTIKNISGKSCNILGADYIKPIYTAQNISVTHQGSTATELLSISPGQTVSAKIRYPNGPQCSGGIDSADISFTYQISPVDTVTFKNQNMSEKQIINVCKSAETTEIQVWPWEITE